MKKIVLAVMAVAAIGLASCGNKTAQGENVDSVAIVDSIATGAANETIEALSAQLESKDAGKLQESLVTLKETIAELIKTNPEVAKEYVAKVQAFLKDNAETVKAVVGDNAAVTAAVAAITEIEPASVVDGLLQKTDNVAADTTNIDKEAKKAIDKEVDETKKAVKKQAQDEVDEAKKAVNKKIDDAAAKGLKKLGL
mgnify:CR=1 FL=1